MKKTFLCILMIVLLLTGCGISTSAPNEAPHLKNNDTIGEGKVSFLLSIVDDAGEQIDVTVKTDKTTVGEALADLNIISGEEGAYGLYINTVNGTTVDYDQDKKYWAFYIDGKYAEKSADQTEINPDSVYMLKVEKV